YGLYASLLGHCGQPAKHGKVLLAMMNDPEKRKGSGFDGIMAAYLMLQPKEGWTHVKGLLADSEQDFLVRYAALRATRFLWSERPELIKKGDLVGGVAQVLQH